MKFRLWLNVPRVLARRMFVAAAGASAARSSAGIPASWAAAVADTPEAGEALAKRMAVERETARAKAKARRR